MKEVAEYLSVDPKTVYRLIQSGQLPAAKIGGVYRIKVSDVDEFFERRKLSTKGVAAPTFEDEGEMVQEEVTGFTPRNCGRCRRIIRNQPSVGGACQESNCNEILCTACWQHQQERYCVAHAPTPEAKLARARALQEQGETTVLVTAEQARERELIFINRFDEIIRQGSRIVSPVDGTPLEVPSWDAIHVEEMEAKSDKHPSMAASGIYMPPRNVRSRYQAETNRTAKAGRGGHACQTK